MRKSRPILFLLLLVPSLLACRESQETQELRDAQEARRAILESQIALVDRLVLGQMSHHSFNGTKREFAAARWRELFDFLVGQSTASVPGLEAVADDASAVEFCLQKENIQEWMDLQDSNSEFLLIFTDVWDWETVSDVLILSVEEGVIVGYMTYAQIPY